MLSGRHPGHRVVRLKTVLKLQAIVVSFARMLAFPQLMG